MIIKLKRRQVAGSDLITARLLIGENPEELSMVGAMQFTPEQYMVFHGVLLTGVCETPNVSLIVEEG